MSAGSAGSAWQFLAAIYPKISGTAAFMPSFSTTLHWSSLAHFLLRLFRKHWLFGDHSCSGCAVHLYGSNHFWKSKAFSTTFFVLSWQQTPIPNLYRFGMRIDGDNMPQLILVARLNTLETWRNTAFSRGERIRKHSIWSIEGFKAEKYPSKVSYDNSAVNPIPMFVG